MHIHHITLTVVDKEVSAEWYQHLLGKASITAREGIGWTRTRLAWPSGLVIGLTENTKTKDRQRFDEGNIGLDHRGIGCESESEVRNWATKLDSLGFARGPVEDVSYCWAVTTRDPNGIPIEFFCLKS
jgi:catechol 2,3-dioxygenase-like lactoylglutathione lyase family enzyme